MQCHKRIQIKTFFDRNKKYIVFVSLLILAFLILQSFFEDYNISIPTALVLMLLILEITADHITTQKVIELGATEKNPLANMFFKKFGLPKGQVIFVLLFVPIFIFVFLGTDKFSQLAMIMLYIVVLINNSIVIRKKRRVL